MTDYDTIVIGAGNGGLAAALTLARKGLNVLLLERHNIPGGSATSFRRGRFEFEVALHQLSGMGTAERPGPLRGLLGKLGVLDDLEFVEMSDLYRVFIPDTLDLTLKADRAQVIETLQECFPAEREAIRKFFDLIYAYAMELYTFFKHPEPSRDKFPLLHRYAFKNAGDVLDEFFADPLLKAVPGAYWGFIGLTPDRLPFSYLAMLFFSYIEFRPCHIKGGSQALSNALVNRFMANGGTVRYNCGAKKIVVSEGKVRGVITEDDDEIRSQYVISNASKVTTYAELIDREHVPEDIFLEMGGRTASPSGFNVYMGLDCEPEDLGITAATNLVLPDEDLSDRQFNRMKELSTENNLVAFSCYDVADPAFSPAGTCQVALVTLKYIEPWLRVPPQQYAQVKYRWANAMIDEMALLCPNVREHIEEVEVATPLTYIRYLGSPRGAIYGFEQYNKDSLFFEAPRHTPIQGLHIAGGWAGDCGFEPTLKSGAAAAGAVLRAMGGEEYIP